MSFKQNNIINTGNYEEYFLLYMDNELTAEQKLMVEAFLTQHSHLREELDSLTSTRLPLDEVSFGRKEELLSPFMKANTVDEKLFLYIDNELPSAERKIVEQKISSNNDYALQHSLLMQTKLDASEKISHPNKKELYRHTERVVVLKVWMRIAAVLIILLFGTLFLLNKDGKPIDDIVTATPATKKNTPVIKETNSPIEEAIQNTTPVKEETVLAKSSEEKQQKIIRRKNAEKKVNKVNDVVSPEENEMAYVIERKAIKFEIERFTSEPKITDVAINKTITHTSVTSASPDRKTEEDTQEAADPGGDFKNTKKTPAKGFFRKVSRFIERNTGIGTANADNELLIGAVSLKLK